MKMLLMDPKLDEFEPEPVAVVTPVDETQLLDIKPGYLIDYCGTIKIGSEGDVKQVEKAIRKLINSGNTRRLSVRFECLELGIRVSQDCDNKVRSFEK